MRPRRPQLFPALGVLLVLVAAACGGTREETRRQAAPPASAEQQFGFSALRLGQSIAELRGHYVAGKELYAAGDFAGAKVHADHPVQELYRSFRQAVAERDPALDREIRDALDEGVALIDRKAPAAEFSARVDKTAGELMDRVLRVAHPGIDPGDPVFTAAVAAGIVDTAATEYEAAVPGDQVKLLAEYQDSYGFQFYCRSLVGGLGDLGGRRGEIDTAFAGLEQSAYKSRTKAPSSPVAASQVRGDIDKIVAALEAGTGRKLLPTETTPAEELKAIAAGLDQVVALHGQGKKQEALDAAAAVYVDRFEGLEADIGAANPALLTDLERRISTGVRDKITAGAPFAELQAEVTAIKQLLPEAEKALGGNGTTRY